MSDIVLLGPPGSGKGTQATRIASRRGWAHLSTGDLFRAHLRDRSALGEVAKPFIDRGALVPDSVTVEMVRERLRGIPAGTRVVFDGFPRTITQADALDSLLSELGRSLAGVVLLEVPRDELLTRIAKRATCGSCHAVYSLATDPPKRPGVCDRCGGAVQQRSDETAEVVEGRLRVYEAETKPLIEHYGRRGLLRTVDGRGALEVVGARIAAVYA